MNKSPLRLALIGDYNRQVTAHQAISSALQQAAETLNLDVRFDWLRTDTLKSTAQLQAFDGFWAVPATPYRQPDGALLAIRYAREQQRPFLGTCGGFQHALLEYARNVLVSCFRNTLPFWRVAVVARQGAATSHSRAMARSGNADWRQQTPSKGNSLFRQQDTRLERCRAWRIVPPRHPGIIDALELRIGGHH